VTHSCKVSGARSAPFGHTIVPSSSSSSTFAKKSASRRGSKTPRHGQADRSSSPSTPSSNTSANGGRQAPRRQSRGSARPCPSSYGRGGMRSSGCPSLANRQSASSSSRWRVAHSRTSRNARSGSEPPTISLSRWARSRSSKSADDRFRNLRRRPPRRRAPPDRPRVAPLRASIGAGWFCGPGERPAPLSHSGSVTASTMRANGSLALSATLRTASTESA
jgi:hypothetical protein